MCKLLPAVSRSTHCALQKHCNCHGSDAAGNRRQETRASRDIRRDVADETVLCPVDSDVDRPPRPPSPSRPGRAPGRRPRRRSRRRARSPLRGPACANGRSSRSRAGAEGAAPTGFPTMLLRPITTAFAPASSTPYSSSSSSTPSGVPGTWAGVPARSSPPFNGWMPSTSFSGSIALITRPSSMSVRQRQLDEDAVDRIVRVQLGDEREQLLFARRSGQAQIARLDPDLERRLVLQSDVDLRGRVVSDEHGREADRSRKRRHLARDLRADPRRERLPVHQRRRHGHENKLCRCACLARTTRSRSRRGAKRSATSSATSPSLSTTKPGAARRSRTPAPP